MIILILIGLVAILIGYVIGRIADNYFNVWLGDPGWIPDHWVWGFVMMLIAFLFPLGNFSVSLFGFGLGHLISDLKDCMRLKFFGPDAKEKGSIRFWHID